MQISEAQPIVDAFGYLQHGLITSAQAADSGIDTTTMTRMYQRDLVRRVRRGVYILAGVAEDSLTDIRAAWLATAPRALAETRLGESDPIVVSHASAASILDLGDITPAHHTFSSPIRKQSSAADIRHRMAPLPAEDITVIHGIPLTAPVRTVVDLAHDHLDGDQLHQVVATAIHDHRVPAAQIAARITPYAGSYGYSSGEALVAEALKRFPQDVSVVDAAQFSSLWSDHAEMRAEITKAIGGDNRALSARISRDISVHLAEMLRQGLTQDIMETMRTISPGVRDQVQEEGERTHG